MQIIEGISASNGIAIGKSKYLSDRKLEVYKIDIEDIDSEIKRFNHKKEKSIAQIDLLIEKAHNSIGKDHAQIFEIHKMMLEDLDYNDSIINTIKEEKCNAEYAVSKTKKIFHDIFDSMDDEYMRGRATDVLDISDRLLDNLFDDGHTSLEVMEEKNIIVSRDLTPSKTISLDKEKVLGFVTEMGSSTSHSAILARNLNIPAVVGLGDSFNLLPLNSEIIIDGYKGIVIVDPDEKTINEYTKKIEEIENQREIFNKSKNKSAITKDGVHVEINSNIGNIEDAESALFNGSDGVGLFRSEFLYLESPDFPSEQVQFEVYRKTLEIMGNKRVIVRTLDLGSDKQAPYFNINNEENPALGYRALRICLDKIDMFKTQLRALYRSSFYGKLAIMIPMVISVYEIVKVKELIEEVKKELDKDKVSYSDNVELGVMIETPASVMISDKLAQQVDFFSVGTNDLTQYTLATDRVNAKISRLYNQGDLSVMRMIKMVADNAHKYGKWIGICGESASNKEYIKKYLVFGIDELSVSPPMVPEIKEYIRSINVSEIKSSILEELE